MRRYAVFGPGSMGGKPYDNWPHVSHKLSLLSDIESLLLDGGVGVGRLAEQWATQNGVPFRHFKPVPRNINQVRLSAAFALRDVQMIEECDAVILFAQPSLHVGLNIVSGAILAKKDLLVFHI